VLRCEECGRRAKTPEEARRWRAYLSAHEEGGGESDTKDVAVYCPGCANREFGSDAREQ
jgi:hypothetical protein